MSENRLEIMWGVRLLDEGFTSIPNLLIRNYRKLGIEHGEWGLICQILTYKHDTREPYPSRKDLADHLCCSERQIDKWVKSLRDKRLLRIGERRNPISKQWGSTVYSFKPLLNAVLSLVGEESLPPSQEEFEVIWDEENTPCEPEVRKGEKSEPCEPEVRKPCEPEVRTKIKSKNKKMIDCGRDEVAAASSSESDPVYMALEENASRCMIMNDISLKRAPQYIDEIYTMLTKQFKNQLDPHIVERACDLFSERAYDWKVFKMRIHLDNPVGFFHTCYEDAFKQFKARRGKKSKSGEGAASR